MAPPAAVAMSYCSASFPTASKYPGARGGDRPASNGDGGGVFVSAHFNVGEATILEYLARHKLYYKLSGEEIVFRTCHFCPKPHLNKVDNLNKLYMHRTRGCYHCKRCDAQGSWFDFKKSLDPNAVEVEHMGGVVDGPADIRDPVVLPTMRQIETLEANLNHAPDVAKWLTETRGIRPDILKKYRVGVETHSFIESDNTWKEHRCVIFPWLEFHVGRSGVAELMCQRLKARAYQRKEHMRLLPKGGGWGMFGWHTVPDDATELIITEGEFDAMAAHQGTGMPSVSLPTGARSLPVQLLPRLERFKRIYLWMDDDVAGQEGAEKFSTKLGQARCALVRTRMGAAEGPKDANDALLAGMDLEQIVRSAKVTPHGKIATFSDFREEIYNELINPDQVSGRQSSTVPGLNRLLKGHRRGELTIFTGRTGSGKTTVLSQLSIDYCQQGVNTLWGSFEIKNTRLAKKMLMQYASKNLEANVHEFPLWANRFSELGMYFMRFFGSTNVDEVIDAMDYAVYALDVEHVVLDNLQFMVSGQAMGLDKFDLQDGAVHKLRQFATHRNVHVTLVIHPRKEQEDRSLGAASVFGTAKATQEADNVIILQTAKDGTRSLDVVKNRFDGQVGSIPIMFNRNTLKVYEMYTTPSDKPEGIEAVAEEALYPDILASDGPELQDAGPPPEEEFVQLRT